MTDPLKQHSPADFPTLTAPGNTPVLTSIFQCSEEFLGQLKLRFEQNPPSIPITSILGFSQFTAKTAFVADTDTTTSATNVDLTHPGPEITGLSDGKYVVIWSGLVSSSIAGNQCVMSLEVNGAGADTGDNSNYAANANVDFTTVVGFDTATLKAGNNTLNIRYRTQAGATGTFAIRSLLAIRFANS